MENLATFKKKLVEEGKTLIGKLKLAAELSGIVFDSLKNKSVLEGVSEDSRILNVLRFKFTPEQLEPEILYGEYKHWIGEIIKYDTDGEIKGIEFPDDRIIELHELGKIIQDTENFVNQLEMYLEKFFIRRKGKIIEIYNKEARKSCFFAGPKMVKLFGALMSSKVCGTKKLNLILGYLPTDKGAITDVKGRINEKFCKKTGAKIDVVVSGITHMGYRLNDNIVVSK